MGTLDNQRAKELAIRWGLNVRHALYRATGNWYHRLKKFPGALLDADGYVIFESSQAFEECPQLQVRKQVSAPKGIKAIPSYVYVSGDRDRQSSMVIADDIKIIEQIEKQIGKKLKRLPLKNIMLLENNGYVLNDAGQLQGLNLDGTKVKDISFLRNLGGLTHLSLANNQITDLTPLRTLTNLKNLELRNNKIEDITPLTALTHLERLILIKNRISDISPLSGLIEINTLSLSNNKIIGLSPLIPLTSLTVLWLNKNNIDDLTPLRELTQLVTLGLRLNRINDITPLKELPDLKGLNVSINKITKLPPDIDRWRWWSSMEITWVDDNTNEGLNLFGNPLTDPPVEIVKQGKAAIKNYFDSLGNRQTSSMIKQNELLNVMSLLSKWLATIKSNNDADFFDVNRISEDIALKLLNEIYGYNLKNLGKTQTNDPGIDLGDDEYKIAFQVTVRSDPQKIYNDFRNFTQKSIKKYTNGIRFLILSEKKPKLDRKRCNEIYPGFDPENHILSISDLSRVIDKIYDIDIKRFQRIVHLLEKEFSKRVFNKEIKNSVEERDADRGDIGKNENYGKKIFISYSHRDKEFVNRLTVDLENAGINIWLDAKEIKVGDSISKKIEEGISESYFLFLVISSNSVKSKWVESEYSTALNAQLDSGTGPKIIPILIEEVQLPAYLRDIKYADFSRGYKRALDELLKTLKREPVGNLGHRKFIVTSQDEKFMEEFRAEIEKILSEKLPDFSIDKIYGRLEISRSAFFKRVKAITGVTPNEYIMSYRLERAYQLLKQNYRSVTELGLAVGFESSAYFAKCFKEKFGQLPNELVQISLEEAVYKLFQHFLEISEQDNLFTIANVRHQVIGRQFVHDFKFVCEIKGNRKLRFLIECKNYLSKITKYDIADKLLAAEAYNRNIPIDHWILVSPNKNVSNELEELIELWEEKGKYPFKVQAWTPTSGIKEFFGLIPEIYDCIIEEPDIENHPTNWTDEKRQEVVEYWKKKLEPPLRLPKAWEQYLRNPGKFLLPGEPPELESLLYSHLPLNCLDEAGVLIHGKTLDDKVMEWLEKPVKTHPTLILLGGYGDGKTIFCYILSRKLAEQFLKSPSSGWLPVRFSLKDFNIQTINTSQEFLLRRLEEIGADIDGWVTLAKSKYNILAILDGFDEMSKKLDHKTIQENIKKIIECYNHEFSGMKILITSRPYFFENQQDKNQLLQRIGNPQILRFAPIENKVIEEYLREYAKDIGEEERFNKLMKLKYPIGLASRPLFQEMLKLSLKEIPDRDLDELSLYETYIHHSLEREYEYLWDEGLETSRETIIESMKEILENVAIKLHQTYAEFIYLSEIHDSTQFLKYLWEISNPEDQLNDDEMGRIAIRSLLKRVEIGKSDEVKQWPVRFCHRSIQEYFVARAVCKMVEKNLLDAKKFLRTCYLSSEIIFFSSKIMKNTEFDYTENLQQLILESKYNNENEKLNVGYLGINAANLLSQYKEIINQPEVSTTEFENSSIVKPLDDELRSNAIKGEYPEGKKHLQKIIEISPESKERLKNEFGFIYDFENPDKDENNWKQREAQIDWRRKVWQILSAHNNFELIPPDESEKQANNNQEEPHVEQEKRKSGKIEDKTKTPEEKGEELEQAVFRLFEKFFDICEMEETFHTRNARQQGRGLQFGHDLKFVCGRWRDKEIRFLIECKNYSDKITTDDIAGKLMAVEDYYDYIPIDHWILISPNADLANELERFIEKWEKKGKYPFKVQTWTPATRVQEFFGLDPGIYDKFIKVRDLKSHPKDWSAEKRQEIIKYWKEKLEPPLRLPPGWKDYLLEPDLLILDQKEIEFEKRYNNRDYVEMNCRDETGVAFAQPLEEKIFHWLEESVSESPTIFLLGEFGDGKTFFTYVLSRKLAEKFRASPKEGWLPVRFALKNFESEGFKSTQAFIQHRLNDFRADIAGWNELRNSGYKLLAILDGFDEISKALDPETIQRNINILIKCYTSNYFSDMKLLITSRKHFFENQRDKEKLLDKLDKPRLLHLSPIDRKTTEDYLRKYAARINKEENFNIIKMCHDPIGLASKPLFLDMVQVSLNEPPGKNLNEYTLYEDYINKALKRKEEYSFDEKKDTPKDKIIENLKNVLEMVAQRLHQSKREYVFLSEIRGKEDLKEWLWELSEPDKKCIEDETGHIAARSLLKRVDVAGYPEDKRWPVDFCHRSMREYFVARAVCNMVEKDPEDAGEFLTGCVLSHEIIFFAGEIMKNKNREKGFDYEMNLLKLIEKTRNVENIKRMDLKHLGGNAVNLLYQYKDLLPGTDWSNLVLDGAILTEADLSGKDFSNTSIQYAKLDNVNFTGSNFTHCNLTDVRIEETTPVQSIAISPTENILALYQDGILREWEYQQRQRPNSINLAAGISGNEMKIIAQPGHDLTVLNDRFLFFYDRDGKNLKLKATMEVKPNLRLIKATRDFLILNEAKGKQNRLSLVDLKKLAVVKFFDCSSFTLCDHMDDQALVIFNENEKEKLQVLDISPSKRSALFIPVKEKISCLAACPCSQKPGDYLLGLGLENGAVQIWQIQVSEWHREKLLEHVLHEQKKPIKDICFIDECRIVTGSLDKTIRLLTFNHEGRLEGEVKEFKMTLQCRGMKIDGVTREKIEGKKLRELIDKAAPVE